MLASGPVVADVALPGQDYVPRQQVSWRDPAPCTGLEFQCATSLQQSIDTCGTYKDNTLYRLTGREEAYWAGRKEYTYCREKFYFPFQKELLRIQPYITVSLLFVGAAAFGVFLLRLVRRKTAVARKEK